MTKRQILFWHGRDKNLVAKIEKFCDKEYNQTTKELDYWSGSLDDFEAIYENKFIVYPGQICVTQYNHFGQR